jgi:hypothetical protein
LCSFFSSLVLIFSPQSFFFPSFFIRLLSFLSPSSSLPFFPFPPSFSSSPSLPSFPNESEEEVLNGGWVGNEVMTGGGIRREVMEYEINGWQKNNYLDRF